MAKVNKKKWILEQDSSFGAGELVRMARKEGFRLEPNYVHMTRYHARKRSAVVGVLKSWAATDAVTGKPVRKVESRNQAHDAGAAFVRLITRAGTINASKWLQEIRTAEI